MRQSPERYSVVLGRADRIGRVYGIWWDLINTGIAVLALSLCFLVFSIILIAGRLEMLPFQEVLWRHFIETVPPQKQSEIGIGLLSVTVSAASAAALYLVRVGTTRWALNRRLGYVHSFFAEAILWRCNETACSHARLSIALSSFVDNSIRIFEEVSETHPRAQYFFDQARMKSHLALRDPEAGNLDALDVALDLLAAALICQKKVVLPVDARSLGPLVLERLKAR